MQRLPWFEQKPQFEGAYASDMTSECARHEPIPPSAPCTQRFRRRDYIRYSARLATGILQSRLLSRHRPLMVNIEPTHRCNLHCVYCDKANAHAPHMETGAALRMLDELAAIGTLSVCFDGGEPLVHPDILALLQRAKFHGLRVSMSSNGHLIPRKPEVLRYIDKLKISIDGPSHVHDAGRGAGAFAQALAGARLAIEHGVSVAIRMTLAEHNVALFPAVLAFARDLRIAALFQPAIGDIMDNSAAPATHSADRAAYRAAIDALMALKRRGEPVGNEMLCLEHLRNWPEPKPVPFCSAGRVEAAIGPDGGMFPCGRMGRQLPAPNVFRIGVARAFAEVSRPRDCANCWCTLTLAGCYLYRGDIRLVAKR